jgi:hypothetical protein
MPSSSSSDSSDEEEGTTSSSATSSSHHTPSLSRSPSPIVTQDASSNSLDLLDRIKRMFRLLDLVTEQGSNGRGRLLLTLLFLL